MKPYITYNDKRYEFEAGFILQKEYKKEYTEKLLSRKKSSREALLSNNTEEISLVLKELEGLRKEATSKKLTDKEIESRQQEILLSHPEVLKMLSEQELSNSDDEINEKYCRLMFEKKYPDEKDVFDKFCDEVCLSDSEKGISYLCQLFSSIIKMVFTNVVQEQPQQNVLFDWEKKETTKSN